MPPKKRAAKTEPNLLMRADEDADMPAPSARDPLRDARCARIYAQLSGEPVPAWKLHERLGVLWSLRAWACLERLHAAGLVRRRVTPGGGVLWSRVT